MLSCSIWFSAPSFWMGGGLESRCVQCGWCRATRTDPSAPYAQPTQRLSRPTPIGKVGAEKPYAATHHLMLLMMGVCTRNMSS